MSRPVVIRVRRLVQGIIAYWLGTNATVPPGWSVVSALCHGRLPLGVETAIGTQGGEDAAHDHGGFPHQHQNTQTTSVGTNNGIMPAGAEPIMGVPNNDHHGLGGAYDGDCLSDVDTTPGSVDGIPIRWSTDLFGTWNMSAFQAEALLPYKSLLLWDTAGDPPAGFYRCDGSTQAGVMLPNLAGKFLAGIQAYDGNTAPGSVYGGGLSHRHAVQHRHTVNVAAETINMQIDNTSGGTDWRNIDGHTHNFGYYLSTGYETINTEYDDAATPAYEEIQFVAFLGFGTGQTEGPGATYGAADLPEDVVPPRGLVVPCYDAIYDEGSGLYVPPAGWAYCDGLPWTSGAVDGYGANRPDLSGNQPFVRHVTSASTDGGTERPNANTWRHTHTITDHTHSIATSGSILTTWLLGPGSGTIYQDYDRAIQHDHGGVTTAMQTNSVGTVYTNVPAIDVMWIVRDEGPTGYTYAADEDGNVLTDEDGNLLVYE